MESVHAPLVGEPAVRSLIQQKPGHGQISLAAGQQKRSQAIAIMVGLVHIPAGYPFAVKDIFYRVEEIVPYQKVKQRESVASLDSRSQKRLPGTLGGTAFHVGYNIFRENPVPVNTVFKIILPPGNEISLVCHGGGCGQ